MSEVNIEDFSISSNYLYEYLTFLPPPIPFLLLDAEKLFLVEM